MPTIYRQGPYRFHFYSKEPNKPVHIHAARDDFEAKFWLEPVSLSRNYGFSAHELNQLRRIVTGKRGHFLRKWKEYHEQG